MESIIKDLRSRILPVLMYCQAQKGDLAKYDDWCDDEDAGKKLFYAYYSGLFCRILCLLETEMATEPLVEKCEVLLGKYNWLDIQKKDLELCVASGNPRDCEVREAFRFMPDVDDEKRCNTIDPSCRCGGWTFADVRGSIRYSLSPKEE